VAAITAGTGALAGCEVIAGIDERQLVTSTVNSADGGGGAETIKIGLTAPLTGGNELIGNEVKLGIDACIARKNKAGGINGRQLVVDLRDDGGDPAKAAAATTSLVESGVVGFLGSFGTATVETAGPVATAANKVFFAPITGLRAGLRDATASKYVFNMRASFDDEAKAILAQMKKDNLDALPGLKNLAVFTEESSLGDAGYEAFKKALASESVTDAPRRYTHTADLGTVQSAATALKQQAATTADLGPGKRIYVAMFTNYTASAAFTRLLRGEFVKDSSQSIKGAASTTRFFNASSAGAEGLQAEYMKPPKFVDGAVAPTPQYQNVWISHVVPSVKAVSPGLQEYRDALKDFKADAKGGLTSLESSLACRLFLQGLEAAKGDYTADGIVKGLESLTTVDLGIGVTGSYATDKHSAFDSVWLSDISPAGDDIEYTVRNRWDPRVGLRPE
jgi:ABC-type branched-subunit amino acid transport system substrate-binding protein